jgi:hypothetical protein
MAYGLAHDGRTNAKGIPSNPLHLALLFEVSDTYLAGVPLWLQRALAGPLASLAKRRGVPRQLGRYLERPAAA